MPPRHACSRYAAYHKFSRMLEMPAFERELPMPTGDLMIMNNWRVLHGRAGATDGSENGKQSRDRMLTGGKCIAVLFTCSRILAPTLQW